MLDKVQNVSLEMIQEAANTFIDPENCHILVVGNKDIAENLIQFDSDQNIDYYDYNAEPVKMEYKPLPEGEREDNPNRKPVYLRPWQYKENHEANIHWPLNIIPYQQRVNMSRQEQLSLLALLH